MKDFLIWFRNALYDRRISLSQDLDYAWTQTERLLAIDPPVPSLQARATATLAALNALEDVTTDELEKLGLQKTRTQNKRIFRANLPANVARLYGAALVAFGPHGADMVTLFPQGREVFGSCRDEQLNNHLDQLAASVGTFVAQLGQTAVTLATNLATTWTSLYHAQGTAKDTKSATALELKALRKTLKDELYMNQLVLAQVYFLDEAKGAYFCPQEKLRNRANPVAAGPATILSAVLSADRQKVKLTFQADNAEGFILKRRVFGQANELVVADDIEPNPDGPTDYEDVLPGPGHYEYVLVAWHGQWQGEPSDPCAVDASAGGGS